MKYVYLPLTASESCFALLCLAALEAIICALHSSTGATDSYFAKETSQTELLLHL